MENLLGREDNTNDVLDVRTESREMLLQEIEEKFKTAAADTHNRFKTHFNEKLSELQDMVRTCISMTSRVNQEMDKRGARVSPGKRTIKQQQAALQVPALENIASKGNITWALSLDICRGLCEDLDKALQTQVDVLGSSARQSTLSRFLFAIQGSERKSLHTSILGRECSQMIKRLLLRLFWCARRNPSITDSASSTDNGNESPDWLALATLRAARFVLQDPCFGPANPDGSTIEAPTVANFKWLEQNLLDTQLRRVLAKERSYLADAINRHVQDTESYKKHASQSKRQRTSGSGRAHFEEMEDMFSNAVSSARAALLQHLSEGRNKARECAFKHFGFVLEGRNDTFFDSEDFSVDVPDMSARELEIHRRRDKLDMVVGDAETWAPGLGEEQLESIDNKNALKLRDLHTSFPFLTCKIAYKVRYNVEELPQNESTRTTGAPLSVREVSRTAEWTVTEEVSLHKTALSFLYEGFRAPSTAVLLRSCKESLKAVHSLAIAFRGLIVGNIGKRVSAIEQCLLGEVYLNEIVWEKARENDRSDSVRDNGQGKRVFMFVSDRPRTREKLRKRVTVCRKEYEEYLVSQRENSQMEADVSTGRDNVRIYVDEEDIDTDLVPAM